MTATVLHIHGGMHSLLLAKQQDPACHWVSGWNPWTERQTLHWCSGFWVTPDAQQWPALCGGSMQAVPGGIRIWCQWLASTLTWPTVNPVEQHWDIMFLPIQYYQAVLQTVQVLSPALWGHHPSSHMETLSEMHTSTRGPYKLQLLQWNFSRTD